MSAGAKIVDATGCGDAFRSGLLYGLSEGWDIEKPFNLLILFEV